MNQGCGERTTDEAAALERLGKCCAELGNAALASDVDELSKRTSEGRFYVACVGQFKRGKSTLLNALVGTRVLPEGVIPLTSAVTVLRFGRSLTARVRLHGQDWTPIDVHELRAFVTEEQNPENQKGVEAAEIFVPNELLAGGMCLVDTPGIGSSFTGNTKVTWSFVPHVDAALVVLGADPPITADELQLVTDLAKHLHDFVFVMNKADRLSDNEGSEAATFISRTLETRLGRQTIKLHQVSAAQRLEGRGPPRDWEEMVRALRRIADKSGRQLVQAALVRGRDRIASALLREIEVNRQALLAPVAESEARVQRLRESLAGAEQALRDLGHLLKAEQERLYERLTDQQTRFVERALPAAKQDLERMLAQATEPRLRLRRRGFDMARDIARAWLDRWLDEEQPAAEQLYRDAAHRFVELGNELLGRLMEPDMTGTAGATALDPEAGFRVRSRLYYTDLMTLDPGPGSWIPDLFRGRDATLRAVASDGASYMDRLLETNSSRIVGDLNERVLESRRQLETQIRKALRAAMEGAERALDRARATQAAGSEAVALEVQRLERLREEVLASCSAREAA